MEREIEKKREPQRKLKDKKGLKAFDELPDIITDGRTYNRRAGDDDGRREEELEMRQLNWWKSWRVSPSNILVALNTFLVGQGGQGGGGII